ncbi:MAG: hypothetical protein JWO83_3950 [Caulobacteraceae bacterium]|nr:hypothetical protein [Caulobacteraceae bacterium]
MAYVSSGFVAAVKARKSLWERLHWERIALLGVNFALWAMIVGLFT